MKNASRSRLQAPVLTRKRMPSFYCRAWYPGFLRERRIGSSSSVISGDKQRPFN